MPLLPWAWLPVPTGVRPAGLKCCLPTTMPVEPVSMVTAAGVVTVPPGSRMLIIPAWLGPIAPFWNET